MPDSRPVLGLDLDNTVVNYDAVFAALAAARGINPGTGVATKRRLRDSLRATPGGEGRWTELQGEAYGPGMANAELFPGVRAAIARRLAAGWRVVIVSHKTRFAALGQPHDFHAHARAWIERHLGDLHLPVFLEPTRWAKLRRIESEGCDVFVDDLLDLLQEPSFPARASRVWFAPASESKAPAGILTAASWNEIDTHLGSTTPPPLAASPAPARRSGAFTGDAAEFFDAFVARELGTRVVRCTRLPGGINNLGAELELADGRTVVGKIYKRSPLDPRDRLDHETRFLRLLGAAGITNVPQVIAIDEAAGAALHTRVGGDRWPEDLPAPAGVWDQFSAFFTRLQDAARLPEAASLPLAAEAALTLQEQLAWVQERRDRWRTRALEGDLPAEFAAQVLQALEPVYQRLARRVIDAPDFQRRLAREELVLSPSDFGLHNALVAADGRVSFVDFEYAGWDDPAKTDADFCCQPRHATGRPDRLVALDGRLERAAERTQLAQELLALKWRFIVLAAQVARHESLSPAAVVSA